MNQHQAQKPLPHIRQKAGALPNKIALLEVDIDPKTGGQIPVVVHHVGRDDQKIPAVQIVEAVVEKEPAGPLAHVEELIVVVIVVLCHVVAGRPGSLVDVDPVDIQV